MTAPKTSTSSRYVAPVSFALLAITIALFGVIMIYDSAGWSRAFSQLIWLGIGVGALLTGALVPYQVWRKIAWPMYVIALILLIAVLLPGVGDHTYGAQRWVRLPAIPVLGAVGFQPSEIAKLSLIIFFAAWFSVSQRKKDRRTLGGFLFFLGMIVGLIMLQPDLGTTLIILSSIGVIYMLAREPMKYFFLLCGMCVLGVVILIAIAPYRLSRLMSYFHFIENPVETRDALGSTYHIRQAVIGIGNGGVFGLGPGGSRQKQGYLPFPETDSIFAVIAEEFGLLGTSLFIMVMFLFLRQGLLLSDRTNDEFARLMVAGVVTWFSVQTLLNMGAMVAIIPFTGVPLLFVSYGGSALVVGFFAVGILTNIGLQSAQRSR